MSKQNKIVLYKNFRFFCEVIFKKLTNIFFFWLTYFLWYSISYFLIKMSIFLSVQFNSTCTELVHFCPKSKMVSFSLVSRLPISCLTSTFFISLQSFVEPASNGIFSGKSSSSVGWVNWIFEKSRFQNSEEGPRPRYF